MSKHFSWFDPGPEPPRMTYVRKIRALMKRRYSDAEIDATIDALETQVEAAALLERIRVEVAKPAAKLVVSDNKVVGSAVVGPLPLSDPNVVRRKPGDDVVGQDRPCR